MKTINRTKIQSILKCYAVFTGKCLPTFRHNRNALTFTVKDTSILLGVTNSEDKGTKILRNVGNCLPIHTAERPENTESTPVPLREHHISHD